MRNQQQDVKSLHGEALRDLKNRPPLFTRFAEVDGMSLCFVNPELVEDKKAAAKKESKKPKNRTAKKRKPKS